MLLIRHEVRPSLVHGLGVFAIEDIEMDRIVIIAHPAVDIAIPVQQAAMEPEPLQHFLRRYGCRWGDTIHLSIDNTRFINHSREPNLRIVWEDNGGWHYHAVSPITTGTEITCDYRDIIEGFIDFLDRPDSAGDLLW
jgi:SET domain-containing protein